jgi:hypothetical protein
VRRAHRTHPGKRHRLGVKGSSCGHESEVRRLGLLLGASFSGRAWTIAVTKLGRPVLGLTLLSTPEMRLRHPTETGGRESAVDEGSGTGFDQMSADAYAERWAEVSGSGPEVLEWFRVELERLGWRSSDSGAEPGILRMSREDDERILVSFLSAAGPPPSPKYEALAISAFGAEGLNQLESPLVRVSIAIAGTFPDGRSSIRVG